MSSEEMGKVVGLLMYGIITSESLMGDRFSHVLSGFDVLLMNRSDSLWVPAWITQSW